MTERRPILRLHPDDPIAIALADLAPGMALPGGTIVRDGVPFGHKVALASIAQGMPIRRLGQPVGFATRGIAAGDHVHMQNMGCDTSMVEHAVGTRLSNAALRAAAKPPARHRQLPELDGRSQLGRRGVQSADRHVLYRPAEPGGL